MYNQPRQGYIAGRQSMGSNSTTSNNNSQGMNQNQGNRRTGSLTPTNRIGSTSNRVYGAPPYGMQQVNQNTQFQRNLSEQHQQMARTRSTPGMIMSSATAQPYQPTGGYGTPPAQAQNFSGMKTFQTAGIPAEVEGNPNVQYVRMNWEDILGGKDGVKGLQVSMSPGTGDPNSNRQVRIGMGGAESSNDGSTPLRIVSFQPVTDYAGLKEPTPAQPGQPKFTVLTGAATMQGHPQGWNGGFSPEGQGPGQTRPPAGGNVGNMYSTSRR